MTINQTNELTSRKPLRLWPAVVIAILQWAIRLGVPVVAPEAELFGMPLGFVGILAGVAGALAIFAWWLFFSRAPWAERLGTVVLMIVALFATSQLVHESMARAGMGMMLYILAIPVVSLALVVWAVAAQRLPDGARRVSLVAAIVLAYLPFTLIRTAGVFGGAGSEFHWRWTETPEQRLLAQASDEPKAPPPSPAPAEVTREPVVDTADDKPIDSARDKPFDSARGKPTSGSDAKSNGEGPAISDPEFGRAEWPGFAGPSATASFVASGSILTGPHRPRSRFGGGRSDRAGRRLRSMAMFSTRRSSAATTRSSPPTRWPRASRCGDTATRSASGSRRAAPVRARRRPSAGIASTHSVRPAS